MPAADDPTRFGRYSLIRRVGTGGMAEIWKAKVSGPEGFEKVLAVKKVLPHLVEGDDGTFIRMFIDEAKLAARLVHPNVVQVFDFGRVGVADYFIAMEYVAGSNLARVMQRLAERGQRLPFEVALYVVGEAARGLGYAHTRSDDAGRPLKLVHRDVSPQNVCVSYDGEVKITDFGIAKVASALTMTAEGHVRGKIAYMSPEQVRAQPLDHRSDLFALGVILYELVTSRRLFSPAQSGGSDVYARVAQFRGLSAEALAGIPEGLHGILQALLHPEPDSRLQDAMTLEASLALLLGPGAQIESRHALASLVQSLFEDDHARETTAEPAALAFAAHGDAVQTAVAPSIPPPSAVDRGKETVVTPYQAAKTSASGLTLSPEANPKLRTEIRSPEAPRTRTRTLLAATVAGVVAIGITAFVAGRFSSVERELPAPTPTPFAIASVTATVTVLAPTPAAATTAPASAKKTPGVPRPTSVRTAVAAVATPAPTPRAPVAGSGQLVVSAKPWVDVYVDGKKLGTTAPQLRHQLSAGKHRLKVVNPTLGYTGERDIEVPANGEVSFFVDVPAKAIRER